VETEKPGEKLLEVIRSIKGVVSVEAKDNMLSISTDTDLRRQVSKAIVENNYPLVQMKIREFSLDDIYMKYFREE
jgi:hypothetical protein